MSRFATLLSGPDTVVPGNVVLLYVDVRDVADAVLSAIDNGTEGRFGICAGGDYLLKSLRCGWLTGSVRPPVPR